MTARTIEVQQRTAGGSRATSPPDRVLVQLLEERLTVEALIRRTVEEQLRDLSLRPNLDAWAARQTLDRWYSAGAACGDEHLEGNAGAPPAQDPDVLRYFSPRDTSPLDATAETDRALSAFVAGAFYILVNGRQVERLDEEISFAPDCKVTFLRVTPLVGG